MNYIAALSKLDQLPPLDPNAVIWGVQIKSLSREHLERVTQLLLERSVQTAERNRDRLEKLRIFREAM